MQHHYPEPPSRRLFGRSTLAYTMRLGQRNGGASVPLATLIASH